MSGEPRQRWRVVFRRSAAAAGLGGREVQAAIETNLAAAGVPTAGRIQLAAGLPIGLALESEPLDVTLTERWDVLRARAALAAALPAGHELVDCHDVWLGEPALAAQACGADYRIVIKDGSPSAATLRSAAAALLDSGSIERVRPKGGRTVAYDLRPLLEDVAIETDAPEIVLRISVRIDPERGAGRPEEVVAALADRSGASALVIEVATRLQIRLAGAGPEIAPAG